MPEPGKVYVYDGSRYLGYVEYDDFTKSWWIYDATGTYVDYHEDRDAAELRLLLPNGNN